MSEEMGHEILVDLLRSSWLVEQARAGIYEAWGSHEDRFSASAERTRTRADLIERALEEADRAADVDLVTAHRGWLESLVGDEPGVVPLADLFLARIGDWVDRHAGEFMGEAAVSLRSLGDAERATLVFPSSLPPAPPFEPLDSPAVEPPGPILFRFAILGDLHIGSRHGEPTARAAIADIDASGADLVIQLGDITDHGEKKEFERAVEVLRELEMPLTTMMGNHDVLSIEEQRLTGREYYPAAFGREPDGVIIEHKGFRFAVLDSAADAATPFPPFDFVTGSFVEGPGGALVRGSLTHPQHDLLAEVADPGGLPTFVFLHHPPQPFTAFPPVLFGLREVDSGRLHATVDSGNVWGVFAGHTHRNARTRDFDGVPAHEVGIPRDFPFGYALVDVAREGYSYRFVQLSDEELLRQGYDRSGLIHRRYGRGRDKDLAFVWTLAS